ncbi:hypothetical protein D2V05_09650 [Flagellimonas pelagia]|uniref:O-antigen ligase domain-containing protein n=1 Tax=Flagellimonas pelagia TaxID=2306998 RepID=A0A3A1NIL0_9FLAO|nr:hypothetical protein D2V05_09650 [Allomuricauda maritima]
MGLVLVVLLYLGVISLPRNLYYDIINFDANPRIYDARLILEEYVKSGRLWFGNGLGSLSRLSDIYPWRTYTDAHNVFPLQILNDTGIVGLALLSFVIFLLYRKLKTGIMKLMYIEFVVLLMFHNIFPYFQLFWFLIVLIFTIDRKNAETSR